MLEIKTIPFFVIHLESAKERIPNLLKLKQTFGENLLFWKAMTSGDFFVKEPDFPLTYEFQRQVGAEVKKLILKPGELGCLISHLSILTYMIEKNLDVIGILEDDMELTSDFSALEAFYTINKGRSWDILVLGSNEWVDITKQDEEQKYDSSFPMKDRTNIVKSSNNLPSPLTTIPSTQIDEIVEDKFMLGNVHSLLGKGITYI